MPASSAAVLERCLKGSRSLRISCSSSTLFSLTGDRRRSFRLSSCSWCTRAGRTLCVNWYHQHASVRNWPVRNVPRGSPWCLWGRGGPGRWPWWRCWCCHSLRLAPEELQHTHVHANCQQMYFCAEFFLLFIFYTSVLTLAPEQNINVFATSGFTHSIFWSYGRNVTVFQTFSLYTYKRAISLLKNTL